MLIELLTEALLHANSSRDKKSDSISGILLSIAVEYLFYNKYRIIFFLFLSIYIYILY